MPHTLTETSTYDTAITIPDDGDNEVAATVGGGPSVPASGVGLQALANRTKFLKATKLDIAQMSGDWIGAPPVITSSDGVNIAVGAISGLVLGTAVLPADAGQSLAIGGLSASTWYYLYAKNVAGAIAYEFSVTGPDNALTFKSGDATRRYVCAFRSIAGSTVAPFWSRRGKYVYRMSKVAQAGAFNLVLNAGAATAATAVNCSAAVPPFAHLVAYLDVSITTSLAAPALAFSEFGTNGDSTSGSQFTKQLRMATSITSQIDYHTGLEVELTLNAGNPSFEYLNNANTTLVNVYVAGFQE